MSVQSIIDTFMINRFTVQYVMIIQIDVTYKCRNIFIGVVFQWHKGNITWAFHIIIVSILFQSIVGVIQDDITSVTLDHWYEDNLFFNSIIPFYSENEMISLFYPYSEPPSNITVKMMNLIHVKTNFSSTIFIIGLCLISHNTMGIMI